MAGVQTNHEYIGPEGSVVKQAGLAFTQYLAVRQTTKGPKSRYYASLRGAIGWLRKHYNG